MRDLLTHFIDDRLEVMFLAAEPSSLRLVDCVYSSSHAVLSDLVLSVDVSLIKFVKCRSVLRDRKSGPSLRRLQDTMTLTIGSFCNCHQFKVNAFAR